MSQRCLVLLATGCALSACTATNDLYCETQWQCQDPRRSYCDVEGRVSGSARTCIAEPVRGRQADGGGDATDDVVNDLDVLPIEVGPADVGHPDR